MKVPFGCIQVTKGSVSRVKGALKTGRLTGGKNVRELEQKFSRIFNIKHAVAVSSGGDALTSALSVLYDFGAKRGDEIIVPALSFVATGNSVLNAGFTPVFVDIQLHSLNINPSGIETVITPRTRAIVPVHLMGKPADMDTIIAIAKKHKLKVIEDAAEAYGTIYKGHAAGTMGDMGCFSLYAAHLITAIEGGMVISDNMRMAEILRSLRAHGRACKCEECVINTRENALCAKRFNGRTDNRFIFERIGYSCKMNELEAAFALGQIAGYNRILKKRRANLLYAMKLFERFRPDLITVTEGPDETIGPHAFPVVLGAGSKINRDDMVGFLISRGIDSRSLFASMPTQCRGFSFLGYRQGDFPVAEFVGNNGFHIGMHQELGRRHIEYFVNTVSEYLKR
ncbi:MAG: DegT/DnrJ/EryC1/StrS family aminotransferase [Candidatus Omnitrophica bacterium]|nr:DegT/DnrJ/EryC1/StrS family aminotransferase [Candidatus Omnitrophota bacterium]